VKAYYEARAREYDDWVYDTGRFAERDRPGWHAERERLEDALAALPPARTLDVACGTGWMTQHLPGEIVGIDASESRMASSSSAMRCHFRSRTARSIGS
jgi:ubiquinone/menaquinone biosynthesis C-methylase UbiE